MGCENIMDIGHQPTVEELVEYIGDAKERWHDLTTFISENYNTSPKITFSKCSAKPGWNVKFRKSGKSLCTLYPEKGSFTALVVVGETESYQIKTFPNLFGQYFINVFNTAGSLNGCRWLMLEVKDKSVLDAIKEVLLLKVKPNKKQKNDL